MRRGSAGNVVWALASPKPAKGASSADAARPRPRKPRSVGALFRVTAAAWMNQPASVARPPPSMTVSGQDTRRSRASMGRAPRGRLCPSLSPEGRSSQSLSRGTTRASSWGSPWAAPQAARCSRSHAAGGIPRTTSSYRLDLTGDIDQRLRPILLAAAIRHQGAGCRGGQRVAAPGFDTGAALLEGRVEPLAGAVCGLICGL